MKRIVLLYEYSPTRARKLAKYLGEKYGLEVKKAGEYYILYSDHDYVIKFEDVKPFMDEEERRIWTSFFLRGKGTWLNKSKTRGEIRVYPFMRHKVYVCLPEEVYERVKEEARRRGYRCASDFVRDVIFKELGIKEKY